MASPLPALALLAALLVACTPPAATEEIPLGAGPGSLAPRMEAGADGSLRIVWIEPAGEPGAHALRTSLLSSGRWSEPLEVARGKDWFVNWADVPALATLADGTTMATWLPRAGEDTYAYHVHYAISGDGGTTWSEGRALHDDRSASEHGFVSLVPRGDRFLALWLDGHATGGPGGAMALHARHVGRDGSLAAEAAVDERVCDCCPTAAVATADGVLAAFRDRSTAEVRDISLGALREGAPIEVRALHEDGWEILGCPVNGPALARSGDHVGAAWFTAAGERPRVLAKLSADGGRTFGAPIAIADEAPEGRVDACFAPDGSLWVSWLEPAGKERSRWCARPVSAAGAAGRVRELARVTSGRAAGIGRLRHHEGALVFAWTDPAPPSRVRTLRLRP